MRLTTVLHQATKKRLKSLALSVYFKQPELGMKDYEILSRATAFLLSVDARDFAAEPKEGPYGHLEAADHLRKLREYKQLRGRSQPTQAGRKIMDMGWLEYVPKEYRPQVHVVCSSHVLAPFLWKDYYPQDWLTRVRPEHCTYSLEVYDSEKGGQEPLAKLALDSQPFHHPQGRDISLIHFREEKSSLKLLKSLGVDVLYLRDPEKLFSKGESMAFDGFVVSERNMADSQSYSNDTAAAADSTASSTNEDTRIFYPYQETGTLSNHTDDRFFATTPEPLPEGLCGAPVLDADGDLCGTVEGIVPVNHENKKLAGCAAFMPSFVMQAFVDFVERGLLKQMMPDDLFKMVETAKATNSVGGGLFAKDKDGTYTRETTWDQEYDKALAAIKKRYPPREVEAIMNVVEKEQEEVLDIFKKEGGDLDEIVARIRLKREQILAMVRDQYRKGQLKKEEGATDDERTTTAEIEKDSGGAVSEQPIETEKAS